MALVTVPPILVDIVNESAGGSNTPLYYGPFEFGSTLYQFLGPSVDSVVEVWESTDGGNTWNLTADAPNGPHSGQRYSCAQLGTLVYTTGFDSGTQDVFIQPFNLSTGLWGTRNLTGLVLSDLQSGIDFTLSVTPTGNLFLNYSRFTAGKRRSFYVFWNGATWTAATPLSPAGTENQIQQSACTDAAGQCHVWFVDDGIAFPFLNGKYSYVLIDATGTPAAAVVLLDPLPVQSNYSGMSIEYNSDIYVAVQAATNLLGFWRGSPSSAPITWTLETTAAPIGLLSAIATHWTNLFIAAGILYAVYQYFVKPGLTPTIDEIDYITNTAGIWNDLNPVQLYDEITNPQQVDSFPQANQFIHNTSAGLILADGTIGLAARLETDFACAGFYFPYSIPLPPAPAVNRASQNDGTGSGFARCPGRAGARRSFVPWRPRRKRTCDT